MVCRDPKGREFLKTRGKNLKNIHLMNASVCFFETLELVKSSPNLEHLHLSLKLPTDPIASSTILQIIENKFDQVLTNLVNGLKELKTLSFDSVPNSLETKVKFYQTRFNTNHAPFDPILM